MTTSNAVPVRRDTHYVISRPNGYGIRTERSVDGETWHHGYVRTRDAVAIIYSDPRATRIDVIKDGVGHTRTFNRGYGPRHITTLAVRFAQEVFRG
jgi:hypothetical protein